MDSNCLARLGLTDEAIKTYVKEIVRSRMQSGFVKDNSWGIVVLVDAGLGELSDPDELTFGLTKPGADHDANWYVENAQGKTTVCLKTGFDSHVAVRMRQGTLALIQGIFPWGGAVINSDYEICVGFSGCKEDEDILIARDVLNWLIMHADRVGTLLINNARNRGEQVGTAGADRFTRTLD